MQGRAELESPDTVWWDCLKILRQEDLLAPLELGATGLILKECREGCRLESAAGWLRQLVRRANEFLAAAGLKEMVRLAPEQGEAGQGN